MLLVNVYDVSFTLFILFVFLNLLVFLMAMFGVKTTIKNGIRGLFVVGFLLFVPATIFSMFHLIGRPKPVEIFQLFEHHEKIRVLSAYLKEGQAIYLYIAVNDYPEPISLVLPWDMETAVQLQSSQRSSEQDGRHILMEIKRFDSIDMRLKPIFYPEPQRAPPPKEIDPNEVQGIELNSTGPIDVNNIINDSSTDPQSHSRSFRGHPIPTTPGPIIQPIIPQGPGGH